MNSRNKAVTENKSTDFQSRSARLLKLWQPLEEWQKNFILGLEGCVCKSTGATGKKRLSAKQVLETEEIRGAREWVNARFDEGHFICFFSSRPEGLRKSTERWLISHGFRYNLLVMEKPLAMTYHYVDDRYVQATTFNGRYTRLVRKEHRIQVFS